MGYATSSTRQDILKQANNTMSFPEFLYMCGEKNVVPHLVNKKELEEIFRRTNFPSGERDKEEIQVSSRVAQIQHVDVVISIEIFNNMVLILVPRKRD